jgi:hypothetical protein
MAKQKTLEPVIVQILVFRVLPRREWTTADYRGLDPLLHHGGSSLEC